MLEIKINYDIEHFKPDFFKGFTAKETAGLGCAVAVILASFSGLYFIAKLPLIISIITGIPFAVPVLLVFFVDFNRMNAGRLLKKGLEAIKHKPIVYQCTESTRSKEEGGGYLE